MGTYMNHLPSRSMTCSAQAPLVLEVHLMSPRLATAPWLVQLTMSVEVCNSQSYIMNPSALSSSWVVYR